MTPATATAAVLLPLCSRCGQAAAPMRDGLCRMRRWCRSTGSPWGRNAFDFNWQRSENAIVLCAECECENYRICEDCGAVVDAFHYGIGYLPEDESEYPATYDGREICPGCAPKHGLAVTVGIGSPRQYAVRP